MTTRMPSFVPRLLAYPMHGQRKLVAEGYRTRDGHLIEWFGRLTADHGGVGVVSRPDPALLPTRPVDTTRVAAGTRPVTPRSLRVPDLRDRRRWWVTSATAYPTLPSSVRGVPAVVWNPFVAAAASARNPFDNGTVVMDLLDDWTKHFAFASIRAEVENAYREAFDRADHVTANAEGTVALARRFGRDDVVLLPNGCDPERFSTVERATGPTRVGYVGKIGHRLDLQGILRTVRALPDVEFVFAGPVLDREYRAPLDAAANVRLLGDVHYDDVPELLTTFDVGWVPHNVGAFEVGGDIIKTYEYRAAGLPTLSTPVDGAGRRGIDGVTALPIEDHASTLRRWTTGTGPRVPRMPTSIPRSATWQQKAGAILELVGA